VAIGSVNRHRWAISAVALVAVMAAGAALLVYGSGLPSHMADGTYSSDCCGAVELRGGHMLANGVDLVSYTVQEDDQGPYILPGSFVGTEDGGIVLDGGKRVLKLRLDRIPNPTRISIPGLWGPERFVRSARRAP
jgi:hypothetical protein